MGKIDIEFISNCNQRPIGRIKQGVCGKIIHRSEPFALEDSPQSFGDVQKRTVLRKKEEKQSAFLTYQSKFPHEFTPVNARIVKYHKRILRIRSDNLSRKSAKKD